MQTSSDDAVAFKINTLTVGLVSLLSALLLFLRRTRKSANPPHPWPKVPGAVPIIGNRMKGGAENIVANLEEWARQCRPKSGVFECNLFGLKFFVLCNEEKLTLVDKNKPKNFTKRPKVIGVFESVGVEGLFTAEGEIWRKERRMYGPFLNKMSVRNYVSSVTLVAGRLIDKWERMMDQDGVVKINSDLMSATMDVISLVAFAKDINSLSSEGKEVLATDIKFLMKRMMIRIFSPFAYWKIPIIGQYLDGIGGVRNRVLNTMKNIVQDYETSSISKTESEYKQSFLGNVIMQSKQEKTHINSKRLIGNLLTLFAAGSETTFNTLCSAIYALCMDETGLQEELAEEVLAMKGLGSANLDDLCNKLPRLRSFMYEVLRIKGPAPFFGMQNQEPVEIDGVVLPRGSNFLLLMQYVTTLEPSISYAEKSTPRGPRDAPLDMFCPRRWLVVKDDQYESNNNNDSKDAHWEKLSVIVPNFHETGFRSFGSSTRVCPGRGLAEVEILVFLAFILSKFEVELQKGHPEAKLVTKIAQGLDIDLHLVLKPRRS